MERAQCASPMPGSITHFAQGMLGPSTDLNMQGALSEEDLREISSHVNRCDAFNCKSCLDAVWGRAHNLMNLRLEGGK